MATTMDYETENGRYDGKQVKSHSFQENHVC